MGCGKTTLGKAFSKEKGLIFVDLDWYIEERFHKTVGELFATLGEDGFRNLEKRMLHEVADFENVVIAAGGGTPCFFDNMEFMNTKGETVFLDASMGALFRRLRIAKQQRPLLAGKTDDELVEFIAQALNQRMPFYAQAKYFFQSDELENRREIQGSVKRLSELLQME